MSCSIFLRLSKSSFVISYYLRKQFIFLCRQRFVLFQRIGLCLLTKVCLFKFEKPYFMDTFLVKQPCIDSIMLYLCSSY